MGAKPMIGGVRGKPVASYETTDALGTHEVQVEHGTRRANEYVVEQWRDTRDDSRLEDSASSSTDEVDSVLLREAFRYLHGQRDFLPPDVANAVLVDTPLFAACITESDDQRSSSRLSEIVDLGVEYVEGNHEQRDSLDHNEQSALQYAERIVIIHEDDLSTDQ